MTLSPHQQAVFGAFFAENLPQLPQTYKWPKHYPSKRNPTKRLKVPTSGWILDSDCMTDCITLKQHVNEEWSRITDTQRIELAEWIVNDWGGVTGNGAGTVKNYVKAISGDNFPTRLQGVASYSKILSAIDCRKYAIYDARVAASLNAVQLLYTTDQPHYFPLVNSKSPRITKFIKWFKNNTPISRWTLVPQATAYTDYCQLLHTLKAHFSGYEIYHLEMTLFSLAPVLCEQAMAKYDTASI